MHFFQAFRAGSTCQVSRYQALLYVMLQLSRKSYLRMNIESTKTFVLANEYRKYKHICTRNRKFMENVNNPKSIHYASYYSPGDIIVVSVEILLFLLLEPVDDPDAGREIDDHVIREKVDVPLGHAVVAEDPLELETGVGRGPARHPELRRR